MQTVSSVNVLIFIQFIFLSERNVEVVLSLERQNSLISAVHGGLTTSLQSKAQASHLGRDKCYSTLQQCYSFPMMRDRIQMYIKYCDPCQKQNTHKLEKCAHILKPISIPQKCFSKVGLDLIGPLCESNQKKYIIPHNRFRGYRRVSIELQHKYVLISLTLMYIQSPRME